MATVNIGNLTFTHKGDYDGSTAYVKNDVVYYATNGNAYIAKQNTTGNVPTNGTYWSQFAAGSGGIWNAGLSLGSAGQIVKVNSGGNALEFGTVSSDFVKISTVDVTSAVGEIAFNQQFSSTYKKYKLIFHKFLSSANNNEISLRLRIGTTNQTSSNKYYSTWHTSYYNGSNGGVNNSNEKYDYCRVLNWSLPHTSGSRSFNGEINFYEPQTNRPFWGGSIHGHERNFDNMLNAQFAHTYDVDVSVDGFTLYLSAGANFINGTATLYGLKE